MEWLFEQVRKEGIIRKRKFHRLTPDEREVFEWEAMMTLEKKFPDRWPHFIIERMKKEGRKVP